MADKIIMAFQPIIEIMQGIAYPLSYVAMGTGICMLIIGQKREGFSLMKWAGIGYLMMQWLPGIMKMMHEVGKGMK